MSCGKDTKKANHVTCEAGGGDVSPNVNLQGIEKDLVLNGFTEVESKCSWDYVSLNLYRENGQEPPVVRTFEGLSGEKYYIGYSKLTGQTDENGNQVYKFGVGIVCPDSISSDSITPLKDPESDMIGAESDQAAMEKIARRMIDLENTLTKRRSDPSLAKVEIKANEDGNYSLRELRDQFTDLRQNFIDSYPGVDIRNAEYTLEYEEPVSLRTRGKGLTKPATTHKTRMFMGIGGSICNAIGTRSGYPIPLNGLKSISITPPPTRAEYQQKFKASVNRALKAIPEGVWDDVRRNLVERPEVMMGGTTSGAELRISSLSSVVGKQRADHLKGQLEKAFANKEEFTWYDYGKSRDKRISAKMCDDGVYRAWFSSEYAGTGNGDYYIMLNPSTVMFSEKD